MNPADRRVHRRLELGVSGFLILASKPNDRIPCRVLDVSIGGAFIHCTAPIQIGQELMVEIHFETHMLLTAKVIHNPGEVGKLSSPEKSIVRWARGSSQSGFGVEFVGLPVEKRNHLQQLIDHFTQASASSVG